MGKLKRGIHEWVDRKKTLLESGGFSYDPVWGRLISNKFSYLVDIHDIEVLEAYSIDSKGRILIPYKYVKLKKGNIAFPFNGSEYSIGESESEDFLTKFDKPLEMREKLHKWLLKNDFDEIDNQGLWSYSKRGLDFEITIFYSSIVIGDGKVKLDVPLRGVACRDQYLMLSCLGTLLLIDTKVKKS